MLYGLTPLLLLAARELWRATLALRNALFAAQVALLALGAVSAPLARWIGGRSGDDLLATLTGGAQSTLLPASAAGIGTLLLAVWWVDRAGPASFALRWTLPAAVRVQVGAAVVAAWLVAVVAPWWGDLVQGPVRRAAMQTKVFEAQLDAAASAMAAPAASASASASPSAPTAATATAPNPTAVLWHLNQPSFAFYLGRPTPRRDPVGGELALTRLDRIDPAGLNCGDFRLVYAERGLAVFRIRGAH
jgi:hypothetical protein